MKPVRWLGSSKKDLDHFPDAVQDDVGFGLFDAQAGEMPRDAKPLHGYGGAGVLEIVARHDTDAYRTVYTVEFEEGDLRLHCFQKKSKRGGETPRQDKELIDQRFKQAKEEHEAWRKQQPENRKKK